MKQRPLFLKTLFLILFILMAAGFWGGREFVDSRLPVIEGTLAVPGISDEVRVVRDRWGVPHIRAGNGKDAYFALGFTMAQDRLYQMELQRRLSRGELAEIFGPDLLDVDKKFRTLMLRHRAEAYLDREDRINPDALKYLDAFLEGVNHFVAQDRLPLEYTLLGTAPRPFTRLDAVSAMGYMAYSFANGIKRDSLYTILESRLSKTDLDLLFPEYTRNNRHTVMEPQGLTQAPAARAGNGHPVPPAAADGITDFLVSFQRILDKTAAICPPFTGSNSWVLAPEKTSTGHTLLANDPHISIANPGVWYEAHVQYPGYENYGYHLPLLPFPMLAHNSVKAWALTMFANDDMDLYAETFHPTDPGQVRFKGRWARVREIRETIRVKGGEDVPHTIRVTPHGPVISDFLEGYSGPPVALSWVYHKLDNPILDVVYDIGRVNTMSAFRTAVSRLAAPGLNFSYIDRDGNIAWWAAGRLPIRPAHVSGKKIHDGGSGHDEYTGYLPFDRNPQMENPDNGMIITANNLSTMVPIDPIGTLTGYFSPSDRAARIYELLSTRDKWDMTGLKKIQTDTRLFAGPAMARDILATLAPEKPSFSDPETGAFKALSAWDGFMGIDSTGGTVFQFATYHIMKQALTPALGPDLFKAYINQSDHWDFLKEFLALETTANGPGSGNAPKTKAEIVRTGFREAVRELVGKLGVDPAKWEWGSVHTIEFVHSMGRKKPLDFFYNIGPFPSPAGFTAVNKLKSKLGNHDYKVTSNPSTRRLIDCRDPDNTWSILPTGNSGNFRSPFYKDQARMYITGQYRKVLFRQDQYMTGDAHLLTLMPE